MLWDRVVPALSAGAFGIFTFVWVFRAVAAQGFYLSNRVGNGEWVRRRGKPVLYWGFIGAGIIAILLAAWLSLVFAAGCGAGLATAQCSLP